MAKKKLLVGLVMALFVLMIYPAEKYLTLGSENSEESRLDSIIQSGQFFNEIQEKYNVSAIGVGKEEKVITVRVSSDENEQELNFFLKNKLNDFDIENYKIEILDEIN